MAERRYDTPRAALEALTDYLVLERVAVAVLQRRGYPEMIITESTSDLDRDGFVPYRYGDHDETVLLVSARERWYSKLDEDLGPHLAMDPDQRPATAIFVTSRRPTEKALKPRRDQACEAGVELIVWGQSRLALELEKDDLRSVAERELHVKPLLPGALLEAGAFRDWLARTLPGADADLVGRASATDDFKNLLGKRTTAGRAPVVLVVGPPGVGKTRLAVDVAHDHADTLVAGSGVALGRSDLDQVPVDGPAVLIVDEADRSPDTSGLTALLRDRRYDQVALLLTVTTGSEESVIDELGLDPDQSWSLPLGRLTDAEIDELIGGYGFDGEAFRRHVIAIAEGNPRVAHLACQLARDRDTYLVGNTVDILERFVAHSRRHLDRSRRASNDLDDERQAVAVAVAALAGARCSGRTELAALGEAINCLPARPNDLQHRVNDLVDAGLVEDPSGQGGTHVLRPQAAAAVVLATALRPRSRVRVDAAILLRNLGQHTAFPSDQPALTGLGLPRPHPEGLGLHADVGELAGMLGVLAQAIHLADHHEGRFLLRAATAELIAPVQNVLTWIDVLGLVGRVAPAASELIADVRDALVVGWPPHPDPPLWSDTDPKVYYRRCLDRLLKTLADQVPSLDVLGPDPLMACVLDAAWLTYPALGSLGHDHIQRAASALSTTRISRGADTDTAALARRAALLAAIKGWVEVRSTQDPDGLAADERGRRSRELVPLLTCQALKPLLSLLTEELGRAPSDPNTLIWMQKVFEDSPATAAGLFAATDTAIDLLDRLLQPARHGQGTDTTLTSTVEDDQQRAQPREGTRRGPEESLSAVTVEALTWIVARPAELVAEGARGLGPDNTPLPSYAVDLLRAASDRLTAAVAARWHELPLVVRHHAARSAVVRARTGPRTADPDPQLPDLAGTGDPIAVCAASDADLAELLIISPVDDDLLTAIALDEGMESAVMAERRRTVEELGTSHPLTRIIELLELAGQLEPSPLDFVAVFATAAGRNLDPPATQDLLDKLTERRFHGDVPLLGGALQRQPRLVGTWLVDHAGLEHPDLAALALQTPLPGDLHQAVCDRIVQEIVPSPPAPRADASQDGPSPNEPDEGPACDHGGDQGDLPPDAAGSSWGSSPTEQLGYQAARALARPVGPPTWRLHRLIDLGLRGPYGALDQVLVSIGHALSAPSATPMQESAEADPAVTDLDASSVAEPAVVPLPGVPAVLEPEAAQQLADIVDRALADPVDEDSAQLDQQRAAFGVIPLLRAAPEAMAALLYRRAHTDPHAPIPAPWSPLIAEKGQTQEFAPVADMLVALAENAEPPLDPDGHIRFAVDRMACVLRGLASR